MGEAERSIAVKKRIAIAKPTTREESPPEIYTPKRRKSITSTAEVSPPPYIPSRKDPLPVKIKSSAAASDRQGSSTEDARQLLERRDRSRVTLPSRERRELISRSRRLELFQTIGIDRQEGSRTLERNVREDDGELLRKGKGRDKYDIVRNFKITAHVAPSARLSEAAKERLTKAIEEKDRPITLRVVPSLSSKRGSVASRLGKVVVQRQSSQESGENKTERKDNLKDRRLALSRLGKDVVKRQCEAAVLSVKSIHARKFKDVETHDSRVVESHTSSEEEEEDDEEEEPLEDEPSLEIAKTVRDAERSKRESPDKDLDDLVNMIKDDSDTDLNDEFTLDLEDDDDLIKVVGQVDDEMQMEKSDVSSGTGTKFIVTLDGVDERQFEGYRQEDLARYSQGRPKYEHLQPSTLPPKQLPIMPRPIDQAVFVQPQDPSKIGMPVLKTSPPKIQPFSINLKDSDDEFEDKADLKGFSNLRGYHQQVLPVVEVNPMGETAEGLTALQKAKLSERCKFWPACAAGADCKFHHPTTHCKTFPNCKFGDKCLFIHPNCKFDSKCVRVDCPFTHTSRRQPLGTPAQSFIPPAPAKQPYYPQYIPFNTPSQTTVCRFFPNCHNVNCTFVHPKPCRFGLSCQSSGCPFSHPLAPAKGNMKWSAQSDQTELIKETATSTKKPPHLPTPSLAGSTAVSSTSV